jgi:hypothetical protein
VKNLRQNLENNSINASTLNGEKQFFIPIAMLVKCLFRFVANSSTRFDASWPGTEQSIIGVRPWIYSRKKQMFIIYETSKKVKRSEVDGVFPE